MLNQIKEKNQSFSEMKKVYSIPASDIAGICGLHAYQEDDEVLIKFLRTNCKDLYTHLRHIDLHCGLIPGPPGFSANCRLACLFHLQDSFRIGPRGGLGIFRYYTMKFKGKASFFNDAF